MLFLVLKFLCCSCLKLTAQHTKTKRGETYNIIANKFHLTIDYNLIYSRQLYSIY